MWLYAHVRDCAAIALRYFRSHTVTSMVMLVKSWVRRSTSALSIEHSASREEVTQLIFIRFY